MTIKTTKRQKNILLRVALLVLGIYVIIMLVQLQMQISEKRTQLSTITAQIEQQIRTNEDLQQRSNDNELYLEQKARENGYARPGESIYREIPGGDGTGSSQ